MTPASLAAYGAACFVLFITPGPGMAAVVARTIQGGPAHGATYGAGIFSGDIIILGVVVAGLAAAAQAAGPILDIVRYVAAVYLAILGVRGLIAGLRAPSEAAAELAGEVSRTRRAAVLAADYAAGVATPFANPKALFFYGAFVPAFFDLSRIGPVDFAAMAAVMAVLAVITVGAYVFGAGRIARILGSSRLARWSQVLVGLLFLAMAGLLLAR